MNPELRELLIRAGLSCLLLAAVLGLIALFIWAVGNNPALPGLPS